MIKLENVALNDLYLKASMFDEMEYKKLLEYKVLDCQQLFDLVNCGNLDFDNEFFKTYIFKVNRCVDKANNLNRVPEIYILDNYSGFGYDESTIALLKNQDLNVKGNDLLYANPFGGVSVTNNILGKMSVAEVKYLLEHCVVTVTDRLGKNALGNYRGFGKMSVKKVVQSLKLYEEQVNRILRENGNIICDNLFYINYDEKVMEVLNQIGQIVNYFVNNAQECVWGIMSDFQKRELIDALYKSSDNPMSKPIISRFVNCIANYTTVSELEKGLVKTKTLNRFILK